MTVYHVTITQKQHSTDSHSLKRLFPRKIRQRIDRAIDIQQGRIGVEVGGEFDSAMPHGSLSDSGMDTRDGQVGAEGGAQGMDVDDSATCVILCNSRSLTIGIEDANAGWVVEELGLEIQPVIPSKSNENRDARPVEFDKEAYRDRNIIERLIGWLKECRRIFTRYEKKAKNFGGMIKLAFIQRYLKIADA